MCRVVSHNSTPPGPVQDDLVCLPAKLVAANGGIGPLVLCTRVTNTITLTDPSTLRTMHLDVRLAPLSPLDHA